MISLIKETPILLYLFKMIVVASLFVVILFLFLLAFALLKTFYEVIFEGDKEDDI